MRFTKMQGLGNDYVYVNGFSETVADPPTLARSVSDRHRGIGGDGLILILPSDVADARMRIFNADGSEAEMCGNGLRCVAKYVYEHGLASSRGPFALPGAAPRYPESLCVETGNGVLTVGLALRGDGKVEQICVNMGTPKLAPADLPVRLPQDQMIESVLPLADTGLAVTCVSMGNPHAVIFVDDLDRIPLTDWGPQVENHPLFPERTNAHFVEVLADDRLKVKTWERGSGITQACGTGACACCVAGVLTQRSSRSCTTELPGGALTLTWHEQNNAVYMTGPATEVFTGDWPDG